MTSSFGHNKGLKLKLREPGSRDTVLKVASSSSAQPNLNTTPETDAPPFRATTTSKIAQNEKENPLLVKIKQTLIQSDPSKWETFGTLLNPAIKHPKPFEFWEFFYCITIANGILVFRSSTPVSSQYFGGGYNLSQIGPEKYSIELRPRAWDARTLLDPYFRSSLEKDKQVQVLAESEIAKSVFLEIQQLVNSFCGEKRKEIVEQIEKLSKTISDRTRASAAEDWTRTETVAGAITFATEFDGIKTEISYSKKDGLESYKLNFSKEKAASKQGESGVARELFALIEEKKKSSSLEALSKVLEDAGF